jgi:multidrug efflux pump subunit AcrA (membrane-fusion protein)
MTRISVVVVLGLLLGGCGSTFFTNPFGSNMLAKADRLTADGDYRSAVAAYDAYLAQYSDDSQAVRARRDAVASIMTTRDEIARLNLELARVRDELTKREGDLAKVRQEAEKLRADLERLKQIDLQLEKRK